MIGKDKQIFYICIIIIGIIIALPFNYIYGMGGFEVDVVWAIFGIIMIASGVHLLKKFKKLGWYVFLLHIEMVLKVAKSVGVK